MDRFEEQARERLERLGGIDLQSFSASFVLFRLATQYLSSLESAVHRTEGLSTAGFRVMFTIWVHDELEPREIARLSGVSTAAVSGVLGTLETKGMIVKERHPSDRRLIRARLTDSGRDVLTRTYRAQNEVEANLFGQLEDVDRLTQQLRNLLEELGDR